MKILRRIARHLRTPPLDPVQQIKASLKRCGENVFIRLPCVIEHAHLVHIADDVSVGSYLHVRANGRVRIGARTMIASHVPITSATHDPDSAEMYKTLLTSPVLIENDVWVGAHTVIFPGIVVGEHSVIAAGSIVRNDVPPYAIVAGVPAKVVRLKQRTLLDP